VTIKLIDMNGGIFQSVYTHFILSKLRDSSLKFFSIYHSDVLRTMINHARTLFSVYSGTLIILYSVFLTFYTLQRVSIPSIEIKVNVII